MEKINKFLPIKIRSIDDTKGTVEAVVSSESIDRYGEVIKVDAYQKRLKTFMKHPVLLSSHNYNSLTNQIGTWEKIWSEGKELVGRAKYFINSGNPEADWGFFLAKNGVAAFSVGFLPFAYEDADYEKDGEAIKAKKIPYRTYTDVELLEISQVLVPANPTALQKSINSDENEDIKEYAKEILPYLTKYIQEGGIEDTSFEEEVKDAEVIKPDIEDVKNIEETIIVEEELKEIATKDITEEEDMGEVLESIKALEEKIDVIKQWIEAKAEEEELFNKQLEEDFKELDDIKTKAVDENVSYIRQLLEDTNSILEKTISVQPK